jgi:hypothetical protein
MNNIATADEISPTDQNQDSQDLKENNPPYKKKNLFFKFGGFLTTKLKIHRKKKIPQNTIIPWLQELPLELLFLIFSFLDNRDLVSNATRFTHLSFLHKIKFQYLDTL